MGKTFKIYDDAIEIYQQDFIEKFLTSQIPNLTFPWCYIPNLTHKGANEVGFGTDLRGGKDLHEIINPFHDLLLTPLYSFCHTKKILIDQVLHFRTFLQTPSPNPSSQAIHIDRPENHMVMLYYVNDSDGDTIFYDDNENEIKRVTPKKGRIAFFDGSIKHSGSSPSNSTRIVINYNFQLIPL